MVANGQDERVVGFSDGLTGPDSRYRSGESQSDSYPWVTRSDGSLGDYTRKSPARPRVADSNNSSMGRRRFNDTSFSSPRTKMADFEYANVLEHFIAANPLDPLKATSTTADGVANLLSHLKERSPVLCKSARKTAWTKPPDYKRGFSSTGFDREELESQLQTFGEAVRRAPLNLYSKENLDRNEKGDKVDKRLIAGAREWETKQRLYKNRTRRRIVEDAVHVAKQRAANPQQRYPYYQSKLGVPGDSDLQKAVQMLEALQASRVSQQDPSPLIDELIYGFLRWHPELRQRLALMTSSAILRQRILSILPPGGRATGSAMLGSTHFWRALRDGNPNNDMTVINNNLNSSNFRNLNDSSQNFMEINPRKRVRQYSDHNWPSLDEMPGRTSRKSLPFPAEYMRQDPTLLQCPAWSLAKAERLPALKKESTPGPGYYGQPTTTKGLPFEIGDTVIMGPHHSYPFKTLLTTDVTATKAPTVPAFSFGKTRRAISDIPRGKPGTTLGVKTDRLCLAPGAVYEHYSSFRKK